MLTTPAHQLVAVVATGAIGSAALVMSSTPAAAAVTTHTSTTTVAIGAVHEERTGSSSIQINEVNGQLANPYPAVSDQVTGLAGTVTDITLQINGFSHERPRDVDMLLVHGNRGVVVMSDVGGTTPVSGMNLTIDDSAPDQMSVVSSFPPGSYRPTDSDPGDPFPGFAGSIGDTLAAFDGMDGNGGWSLHVLDDSFDFFGSIAGWKLEVTTTGVTPYPAPITVSGVAGSISDVNVTLNGFSHASTTDVDFLLVGPDGQQATILSDASSSTPPIAANLTLDDDTAVSLGNPIASGTYRPENQDKFTDPFPAPAPVTTGTSRLSIFDGTDPNGTWKLYVTDDTEGARGEVSGWSLQISSSTPTPAAPVITTPTTGSRDADGSLTIAGTAQAGSTVTVRDNGVVKPTVTASGSGQWSTTVSGLADGSHTLTATASLAGTISAPSAGVVVHVDTAKPTVTTSLPAPGATGVSRATNISATFSEAVRAASITSATVFLVPAGTTTRLPATVTYNGDTRKVVLNPTADLAAGKTYRATVSTAVLDLAGNPLDQNRTLAGLQPKTWTFTTT